LDEAIMQAMPHLQEYLDDLDIEHYVSAPIVSDAAWKKYHSSLPVFKESSESALKFSS